MKLIFKLHNNDNSNDNVNSEILISEPFLCIC